MIPIVSHLLKRKWRYTSLEKEIKMDEKNWCILNQTKLNSENNKTEKCDKNNYMYLFPPIFFSMFGSDMYKRELFTFWLEIFSFEARISWS